MADFSDLVNNFSAHIRYPIKIEDISLWLIDRGYQDEIQFFPTKMNEDILRGQLIQFVIRPELYGNPRRLTYIQYSDSLNVCWKRFVIAKELTHIIDPQLASTNNFQQLVRLAEELADNIPVEEGSVTPGYKYEKLSIYRALALLVPEDAVNKLRAKYIAGELSSLEIAKRFKIPEKYVATVMSERYAVLYNQLLWS